MPILAKEIGVGVDYLKACSCGREVLTERWALRIAIETGVSVHWLLDGNPNAPILSSDGTPWSPDMARIIAPRLRVAKEQRMREREVLARRHGAEAELAAVTHGEALKTIYLVNSGNGHITEQIRWRVRKFLSDLQEEFAPNACPLPSPSLKKALARFKSQMRKIDREEFQPAILAARKNGFKADQVPGGFVAKTRQSDADLEAKYGQLQPVASSRRPAKPTEK